MKSNESRSLSIKQKEVLRDIHHWLYTLPSDLELVTPAEYNNKGFSIRCSIAHSIVGTIIEHESYTYLHQQLLNNLNKLYRERNLQ